MRKLFMAGLLSLLTGCVTATPVTNMVDVGSMDYSEASRFKKGTACDTYVLFFGPFGSSAVHTAALEGKIKSVKDVQVSMANYIFFHKFCTTVYGM